MFAVIKGKSVDEIFKEEQCKQTTIMLSKVSGYVPPTTSLESTKSSSVNKNSENSYGDIKCSKIDHLSSAAVVKSVLQDKTVNIDSRSNGSNNIFDIHVQKKNVLNKESAMLRARRQISFDNVDDRSNR